MLLSKLREYGDYQFISKTSFHIFLDNAKPIKNLSVQNMHYAFDCIWDAFGFGENQEVGEVRLKLRRFITSFNQCHSSRKCKFIEISNYIPAHRHKDPKIIDMIMVNELNDDLHDEDEEILFDLHEYNQNHPDLNLILVSWDKTFINVVEKLLDMLSFKEYVCLE